VADSILSKLRRTICKRQTSPKELQSGLLQQIQDDVQNDESTTVSGKGR